MSGKLESMAQAIAYALMNGAKAEVVGERLLDGAPIRYMEIDGVAVEVPEPPRKEQPGVHVTHQDGSVSLYLTTTKHRAEDLLARAKTLAASAGEEEK